MDIKIGKYSFNPSALKGISLKDAYNCFPGFDKRVVEKAWRKANPKRPKKSPKLSDK